MQKNKKNTLIRASAVGLSVIATTVIVAGAAYAHNGGFEKSRKRELGAKNFAAIQEAIKNNDYVSWSELIGDKKIGEIINEDNFSQFVEMHNLIKEGDFAAADEIREELGLLKKPQRKEECESKKGMQELKHSWQNMEDAREALKDNNYFAWRKAVGDSLVAERITEENFLKLVKSYNLMQSGDFEGAKEIRKELGFPIGRDMGQRLSK